jgi:hypothetical protein
MSTWVEIFILAIASMFWPTLIVIVVLALRLERPVRVLFWFLVGGLLTTVLVGTTLVLALQGSSFFHGSAPTADPTLDLAVGMLSLLAAFLVDRLDRRAAARPPKPRPATGEHKPSVAERAVGGGAVVAFVAGVVLNIVPGTFPIVALKDIAQLDVGNGVKVLTIIAFYVIMFTFVEVPLVAYLVAPEWTAATMERLNAWLSRNGRRLTVWVLLVVGLYLVVRGLFEL